jgi:hypothetical protein
MPASLYVAARCEIASRRSQIVDVSRMVMKTITGRSALPGASCGAQAINGPSTDTPYRWCDRGRSRLEDAE